MLLSLPHLLLKLLISDQIYFRDWIPTQWTLGSCTVPGEGEVEEGKGKEEKRGEWKRREEERRVNLLTFLLAKVAPIKEHLPCILDVSNDGCPGVGVFADLAGDRILQEGLGDRTFETLVHLPHHQVTLTVHLCLLLISRLLLLHTADSLREILQNWVHLGVVGSFAGDLELIQTFKKYPGQIRRLLQKDNRWRGLLQVESSQFRLISEGSGSNSCVKGSTQLKKAQLN